MKPLYAAVAACLAVSTAHAQSTGKPLFEGVRAGVNSTETLHPAPTPVATQSAKPEAPRTQSPASGDEKDTSGE